MKQLLNVFIGALVMSGYMFFESILFGLMFWIGWNVSVSPYFGLDFMTYLQAVGIVFVFKIIKFDANSLNQPTTMVIPREITPKSKSKESE